MNRRAIEIACFAALAWFAAAHWAAGLVADPPGLRVLACVAVAAAVAAALALLADSHGLPAFLLRGACVGAGLGAGFVVIGLERGLLAPARWGELGEGLDRGFAGLASVDWPYDGSEPWTRLVLLLAIPLTLGAAAALASSARRLARPAALVLLVALYGVAVTEHHFGGELARGAALLGLVAAWLWLPQMPERGWRNGALAVGAVVVACTAALPAAARYEDNEPWVDYEAWNPFAARTPAHFDWSHSYGPIDWPRRGTTVMTVRSAKPHYWRLQTLDRFDGLRWERPQWVPTGRPTMPEPLRGGWVSRFRVAIHDFDTAVFPVAGTAVQVTGTESLALVRSDGTVEGVGRSLDQDDPYYVTAYVPDPTPAHMRAAPAWAPPNLLARNTEVFLPRAPLVPATEADIARTPYARVLRLARRLANGEPTQYDVVRAIQRHLRSTYDYDEQPPVRAYPLVAFLFQDEIGYCQQFSGAMALMLRMLDIPARVASGFTPGSYNRDTGEYRVRDLDAHSWVEVWFTGIGWVPFDPTPSAAPADSQSSIDAASASAGALDAERPDDRGAERRESVPGAAGRPETASSAPARELWLTLAAAVLLPGVALVALSVIARRRWAHLPRDEAEVAELRYALLRIGEPVPPRATLRELERRLQRTAGAGAARYVRALRARRYGPRVGRALDAAARRELRRALARGRGLRVRLAALWALPPLSFRRD